ncbi:hypothetical protein A6A04_04880 [Paramagnetospirillum marisnigri]|uniref:BioF2-like acetyltransferase domain-containing protein n=1 Tax=Paramagnetospirillum marisnigri TaxID=1285242 RepID=A0A178MJ62_9PROT|nr:GNAT family N-acetyltransferase [Paramagnetospirillum marisnigri]OAN48095.1 hypothetical protein A6A04_04880 [Paramagnetospirillum marisnigri]
MLRERPKPVSETDAAILDIIERDNPSPQGMTGGYIPPDLVRALQSLAEQSKEVAPWTVLAETLAAQGLNASAVAAYRRLSVLGDDPGERAAVYTTLAALERRLRLDWSAQIDERVANRLRGIPNASAIMPELEEDELYAEAAINNPEAFLETIGQLGDYSLLHDPFRDPYLAKANFLRPPPLDGSLAVDDCSFFIRDGDGTVLLQVEADAYGGRHLGCREAGIILTRLVDSHPRMEVAEYLAVRQLRLATEWAGCPAALFERRENVALAPPLAIWINDSNAHPIPITAAWIDLSLSPDEIERGYRDAHRQSLRWGRRNMRVESTKVPDPRMIELYSQVYLACFRTPGTLVSELVHFMEKGLFTLYIGWLGEDPVVALLASRHGRTTYYWSSSKKIVGNKPLGHVVLHQAIMDAQAEGQSRFDLGHLHTADSFNSKLQNIALYKRGFASHTEQIYLHPVRL